MSKMDKLHGIKLWTLLLIFSLWNLESDAAQRLPDGCGKSTKFELSYAAVPSSDIERFSTGYQGVLWKIYYDNPGRYRVKINFIFPNKTEDNVEIATVVRTGTDGSNCDDGKNDVGIIQFRCKTKPNSQSKKGVEMQMDVLKPFTKEHSGFKLVFQTYEYWNATDIFHKCSVDNIRVEDCNNLSFMLPGGPLTISSTSGHFDSVGKVTCGEENDYPVRLDAFYNTSKCLPNATWENEEDKGNFKCWEAPSINLTGATEIAVGKESTFRCYFTVSDPPVEQVTYTYTNGDSKDTKTYGTLGTTMVSPAPVYKRNATVVNGKQQIQCSVSTKLTRLPQLSDVGTSERQLDEIYAPRLVNDEAPMNCTFELGNRDQSCKFVFAASPRVDVARFGKITRWNEYTVDVLGDILPETASGLWSYTFKNAPGLTKELDNGEWRLRVTNSPFNDQPLDITFYLTVNDPPSGLSGGAIAGIVIGVLVAVAGVVFAYLKFRNKKSSTGYGTPGEKPTEL